MPYQTITRQGAGVSLPSVLNWRGGKPASVLVTALSAGSTGVFVLEYTLDDLQVVGGTSVATWVGVSSAQGSSASTFTVSTATNGVFFPFPTPVAAVRLNATTAIALTMQVMQGEGW